MSARKTSKHTKALVRSDLSSAREHIRGVAAQIGSRDSDLEALAHAREAVDWMTSACIRIEDRLKERGIEVPDWSTIIWQRGSEQ